MKKFNAQECLKALGLEEGGRVQQTIDSEVLRICDPYLPFDQGGLKKSGTGNTVIGSGEVIWKTPYAHYVYEGIVYVDPEKNCAGFMTENGWRSRKNVTKVPTERKLQYNEAPMRGSHWVDRAMQDGGLKELERSAQEALNK